MGGDPQQIRTAASVGRPSINVSVPSLGCLGGGGVRARQGVPYALGQQASHKVKSEGDYAEIVTTTRQQGRVAELELQGDLSTGSHC